MNDLTENQESETAANSDEHAENKRLTPQEWECMKVEFITGNLNGKQLAEEWGVPYSTVRSQMKRHKWTEGQIAYVLQLSADKIKEKHEERMKAQALLDTNTRMFGASMIESLSAGSKLTTDMSKLASGVRAYAGVVKLVREANGLAIDRVPEPEPPQPQKKRVCRFIAPEGDVKYVDLATNEYCEPTPDAISLRERGDRIAALALAGFAAISDRVIDMLLKLVPALPTIRIDQPMVQAKKIARPVLRLVPREEQVEAKTGGARKVAKVRKVAAGRNVSNDRKVAMERTMRKAA